MGAMLAFRTASGSGRRRPATRARSARCSFMRAPQTRAAGRRLRGRLGRDADCVPGPAVSQASMGEMLFAPMGETFLVDCCPGDNGRASAFHRV